MHPDSPRPDRVLTAVRLTLTAGRALLVQVDAVAERRARRRAAAALVLPSQRRPVDDL